MARAIEPYASAPHSRFETMRRLADAGVATAINIAPVIPGLNDDHIPELLERAKAAGATRAAIIPVRLPREVLPVFTERLKAAYPDRFHKVVGAISEMRSGKMNDPRFGARMHGHGARWSMIEQLFRRKATEMGLSPREVAGAETTTFRRPSAQRTLFEQ
jgi:DNA repair photolyase